MLHSPGTDGHTYVWQMCEVSSVIILSINVAGMEWIRVSKNNDH
jgi:hypothetical protein